MSDSAAIAAAAHAFGTTYTPQGFGGYRSPAQIFITSETVKISLRRDLLQLKNGKVKYRFASGAGLTS